MHASRLDNGLLFTHSDWTMVHSACIPIGQWSTMHASKLDDDLLFTHSDWTMVYYACIPIARWSTLHASQLDDDLLFKHSDWTMVYYACIPIGRRSDFHEDPYPILPKFKCSSLKTYRSKSYFVHKLRRNARYTKYNFLQVLWFSTKLSRIDYYAVCSLNSRIFGLILHWRSVWLVFAIF
jgi:hypothetical protein